MSVSGVILSPSVYSSNQTYSNRKVAEENRSGKVDGDGKSDKSVKGQVPTDAINPDFQTCAPLYTVEKVRAYRYALLNEDHYGMWVKPMYDYADRYVLGTMNQDVTSTGQRVKDLDLGTRELHVVLHSDQGTTNEYLLPGDADYIVYLQEMLNDILYTWHNMHPEAHPDGDWPELQRPYEFMQCVMNLYNGVEEISKEISKEISDTKIFPNPCQLTSDVKGVNINFNITSRTQVSINVYDVTGRLISKVVDKEEMDPGKQEKFWDIKGVASGTYFCIIEAGKTVIREKVIVTK